MNNLIKLSTVAALMLGSAIGVTYAQSANNPPPAPPAAEDQQGGWDGWFPWHRGGHGHGRHAGRGGCDHEAGYGPGYGRGGDEEGGWGWRRGGRMMAMIDANGDGVIGDDEAASRVENVFLRMDADNNGEVTLEEYMGVRMGPGEGRNPERMAKMQELKKQRFEAMDGDKDGKVTKAQFIEAAKARFAAADTDKDGKVTPWEFRAQHNPMN